jgi:hypothetical protein
MAAVGVEKPALPAFPGAEGWGSDTPGGRGGKVIAVTNLNPDGPGSLQEACATPGPRIVVFAVSGVISNLITIEHGNITIAGQTAPGAGITIAGQLATKEGISDVVIRHLRVRPMKVADSFAGPEGERRARRLHECGKANPQQGEFDPAAFQTMPAEFHDGASLNGVERLVLDHFTVSWAADESLSVCRSRYVTVQWSSIEAGTIKEGTKYSGYHNFGMFSAYNATGDFISVHHNLFAHNSRRIPSVRDGQADLRNNVVYNARGGFDHDGSCSATGTPHDYNYIGNYFKRGPNSTGTLAGVSWGNRFWWAEFRNETRADRGRSFYFVEDNLWDDQPPPLPPYIEDGTCRLKEPMPAPKVTTQKAKEAYELVLARAGAWPRDAVTRLTIEEVRAGTGDYGRREPKGGLLEGLTPGAAPLDTDKDGMPNEWEKKNGLDPTKDDSAKVMPSGYTAVEVYLNELAEALAPAGAVAAPISDATPVPAASAVAPVTAAVPPPAVPAIKPAVVGIAPDYMGNVPGRANVLVIGGDMVERSFGWSHYLGLLHPEWNTQRLTARGWRVDEAVAGFDEALAACAPADGVLLDFGEAECAAAYAANQTPAQFAEQLKQLVAKVRVHEKTKDAALAFVTPFPVVAEWLDQRTAATYGAAAADERSQALAEAVRKVGADLKVPVVDLHKAALELAGAKPAADLWKDGFLAPTGYGTAPAGGAQCGSRVSKVLTEVFPVKSRDAEAGRKLAAYEAQLADLSRILTETSEGTVRSGPDLDLVRAPNQKVIDHFKDETRTKVPADALEGRRWLTFVLRGKGDGYMPVCVSRTDKPYDPRLEITFADGAQTEIRVLGYGHWSAIAEETPDQAVNWELTSLNFGKNRLRPVSGGPAGKRHWTLLSFDVSEVGDRKVKEAALYLRYGNVQQSVGPYSEDVRIEVVDGRDAWVAHGAATWRTRDGVRPWTGGTVDAAGRGAKLEEFLKRELLPEVREVAAAERAALAAGAAQAKLRPAPQLPPMVAAPAAVAVADEPAPRRLWIADDAPAKIRQLAQQVGSHHQQVLELLKARVKDPNVYGSAKNNGHHAVEAALLSALAESEDERKAFATIAYKAITDWTDVGSATLGKGMEARCVGLAFNWAYPAWTPLQRQNMRRRAMEVRDAISKIEHGNLRGDRTSNFMGVIRGGELLLLLGTGADVKSERCRFLIGELRQYLDNTFGDLGVSLEGPGYTEYPAAFVHAAAIGAAEAGDPTLRDAIARHAFWKLLLYTRVAGQKQAVGTPWGVSEGADLTDGWSSQLLRLIPPDALPQYLWWYDRTTGRRTPDGMLNRFDGARSGSIWSLLFYPAEVTARNPAGDLPAAVADSHGYLFLRNHWEETGTILASLVAQSRTPPSHGWNQPEQLSISLTAHGEPLITGPRKETKASAYSALLVDGKYAYENATATMGRAVAFEPGKSGGYAIVQGGQMYEKLGVKSAVRHLRADFLPKNAALLSTFDRIQSAGGEHAYTWQANVGDGVKVTTGNEGGRPFFLLQGAQAFAKGWVLHPAGATVTAGDPLGVTVKGTDADIWIAFYVGAGNPPVAAITGNGLESVLTVGDAKLRFAAGRLVAE